MPAGRILCLGDDLTRGADDVGGGARTYRGALQQLLGNGGYAVDFVGPESLDPAAGGDDPEHAGFAGASIDATGNASNNLTSRLSAIRAAHPSPDLIVVGAGWWDVLNAPTNLAARFETFVGAIQSGSWSSVKLLLTTLHPRRGETEAQTGGALSAYASLNTRIRSLANAGRVVADAAAFQSADRSLWLESIINNTTLPPDFRTMMSGDGIPATDGGHLTTSFDGLSAYLNEHAGGNPPYPGAGPTPWPSLNSPQSMGRGHPGYLQQVSAIAPWWWNFAGPQHNATNTVLDSRNMFAMAWRKSTDSWDEFFAGARPGAVGLGQHQSVRWVSGSNETGTPHPLAASGFREDGITTWYRPHWDTGFESWPDDTSPSRGIRGFIGRARRDLMVDAKCFLWGVQVRLALLNPQGENDIARSRLLGACGGDFIVPEPRFPGAKHYDYLGFPMQVMDGGHDRWRHITSTDWVWITSCTIGGTGYNENNPNHHYWDPGTPRPLSDNWSPMWAYNNPPAYSITVADLRAKPPPLPSYVSGGSAGYVPTDYWTDPASGQPTVWLTQQGADKVARVMYDRIVAAGLLTGSTGSGGGSTGGLPPAVVPPGLSSPARWFARLTGGLNTWAARAPAANQAPTWVNGAPGTVVAGQEIVGTVRATGTPAPTYSKVAGPAWLSVHPTSGVLSGAAPNIESLETVTLRATNSEGSADQTSTFRVSTAAAILTTSLPPALQNVPYNVPIELAGREPLLLEASGLPAGLSLQGRAIVGTRTDAADALVTLTLTGPDGSATRLLPLAGGLASGAPVILTVSMRNGALGIVYRGELAALGVQPIRWGIEGTLPPGVSLLYDRKNIVPNADFATALAGWSSVGASQFVWDAGRARLRGNGLIAWCGINRTITATVGTKYRVSVTVEWTNTQLALIGRPDGATVNGQRITDVNAAGRHTVDFTARTTTPQIVLECVSGIMVPAVTYAFGSDAQGWTTTGAVAANWLGGWIRPSWSAGSVNGDPMLVSPTGLAVSAAANRRVHAAVRQIGRTDIGDLMFGSNIAVDSVTLLPQTGTAVNNGDGTYTATNGGVIRFLYPLASLSPNTRYVLTLEIVAVTDPTRAATTDWCDALGASLGGAPGRYVHFIVHRSSYDSTFRFFDVNSIAVGTSITVRAIGLRPITHEPTALTWNGAEQQLFWRRTGDASFTEGRSIKLNGAGQAAPSFPAVTSRPEQLLVHSGDFSNAAWEKGVNITANGVDGTLDGQTAYRFTSVAVGFSYVGQNVPCVNEEVYTATFLSDRDPAAAGMGTCYIRANGIAWPPESTAGVVAGAPGTAPTKWVVHPGGDGLTRQIVGSGTTAGIEWIDVRFHGTPTTANVFSINPYQSPFTRIPARDGEVWTQRTYVKLQAGTFNGMAVMLSPITYQTNGTTAIGLSNSANITSTPNAFESSLFEQAITCSGGVAFVTPRLRFVPTIGVPVDFTLRIGFHPTACMEKSVVEFPFSATLVAAGVWRYTSIFAVPFNSSGLLFLAGAVDAPANATFRIAAAHLIRGVGVPPYRASQADPLEGTGIYEPHNLIQSSADLGFAPHWQIGANMTFNGADGQILREQAWKFTSLAVGNSWVGQNVSITSNGGPLEPGKAYTVAFLSTADPATHGGAASIMQLTVNTWHNLSVLLVSPGIWLYYGTVTLSPGATGLWILPDRHDAAAGKTFRVGGIRLTEGTIVLPNVETHRHAIRPNKGTPQPHNRTTHSNGPFSNWSAYLTSTDNGAGMDVGGIPTRRFTSVSAGAGYLKSLAAPIPPGVPFVVAYAIRRHSGVGELQLGMWGGHQQLIRFNPYGLGCVRVGPRRCGIRKVTNGWIVWGVYTGDGSVPTPLVYTGAAGDTWDVAMTVAIGTTFAGMVTTAGATVGEERPWLSEPATLAWEMKDAPEWSGVIDQIRLDLMAAASPGLSWEVDQVQIGEPGSFVVDDFEVAPLTKNHVRNPSGKGVIAGIPGTAPEKWSIPTTSTGIARQIVGSGTEDGLDYIDVRAFGTTTGPLYWTIRTEEATGVPAKVGEVWTHSAHVRLMAGSLAGLAIKLGLFSASSNGTALAYPANTTVVPTGAALASQRFTNTGTLSNASTEHVVPYVQLEAAAGVAIDVTLRIAGSQMELAAAASWFAHPDRAYLYGPPALPGSYGFKARAENALGSDDQQLSITVPARGFASSPWDRFARAGA